MTVCPKSEAPSSFEYSLISAFVSFASRSGALNSKFFYGDQTWSVIAVIIHI